MHAPAQPLRRRGRDATDAALPARASTLDRSTLADPGPARLGQDVQRRADDLLALVAHGKQVGVTANSHKVIGNLLDGGLQGGQEPAIDVHIVQKRRRRRDPTSDDRAIARQGQRGRRRARSQAGPANVGGRHVLAVVAATRWPTRSTCCSSTRPARCRSPTSLAMSPAAQSLVLARRPAAARPAPQGTHPPGAGASALAHRPGRARRRCRRIAGSSSRRRGGSIPDLCRFTSEVFYDDRLEPEEHLGASGRSRATPADARWHRASVVPVATRGNRHGVAGGGRARWPHSPGAGRGRRDWIDAERTERRPSSGDDVLVVAPVQRPGRRHRARVLPARSARSGPSTSSRARRRRSASTR